MTMKHKFLLCIDNEGYEASLEMRKLYENISDKEAERHNQVRIIDESGEDYLYPSHFLPLSNFQLKLKVKSWKEQYSQSATKKCCPWLPAGCCFWSSQYAKTN